MSSIVDESPSRTASVPVAAAETPELAWRVLRLLNLYRALAALVVLTLHLIAHGSQAIGSLHPSLLQASIVIYLLASILGSVALQRRWPALPVQVIAFGIIDIAVAAAWLYSSGGVSSGLGSVLIISTGAASLIADRRSASMLAATAALAVLAQQTALKLGGVTAAADYTPAGVLGAIILVVAMAVQPLARRIRESEALARQRGVDLANLAELNEYIVQHLRESIVVIDDRDRVRLINESAAQHLGAITAVPGMPLADVSPRLFALVQNWRNRPHAMFDETMSLISQDGSTMIHPQFAPIGSRQPSALLIFLEDTSRIAERVQQSKLASLGRLSASIAHEIRNPVGAMSHAGQLLRESPRIGDEEQRLTDIIYSNAQRVSAIIDSILHLSRRDSTRPERLVLASWLRVFLDEFEGTHQLDSGRMQAMHDDGSIEVRMDPMHLHQVLWNLCENGLHYSRPDSPIELRSGRMPSTRRPFLEIMDRGPGISPEMTERIFEPFFTGSRGGTGLGLYISRELCECNRATLLYEPRQGGGSIFRIIFADPQRWEI